MTEQPKIKSENSFITYFIILLIGGLGMLWVCYYLTSSALKDPYPQIAGIILGGFIVAQLLSAVQPVDLSSSLVNELNNYGISNYNYLLPLELFNWQALLTLRGLILIVVGGFLVGFGTRYAGGCTSGHSIMGLSNLQWPSLVATICFMIGGIIMANFILPFILK